MTPLLPAQVPGPCEVSPRWVKQEPLAFGKCRPCMQETCLQDMHAVLSLWEDKPKGLPVFDSEGGFPISSGWSHGAGS